MSTRIDNCTFLFLFLQTKKSVVQTFEKILLIDVVCCYTYAPLRNDSFTLHFMLIVLSFCSYRALIFYEHLSRSMSSTNTIVPKQSPTNPTLQSPPSSNLTNTSKSFYSILYENPLEYFPQKLQNNFVSMIMMMVDHLVIIRISTMINVSINSAMNSVRNVRHFLSIKKQSSCFSHIQ